MKKITTLMLVTLFLAPCITIAKPVSANPLNQNSWVELAPMQVARAWLGVAAVNGKIYAIGGSTASGFEPASFPYGNIDLDHFVGTNEEYNPINNTWSYKSPMPTPRMAFAIATVQDKIYCIGGRSVAGDMAGGYTAVNEVYDPATNTWENKAPMPIANGWIKAKVINNKIYIPNSSGEYYVYDPASNMWNNSVPSPPDGKLLLDYIPNGYATTGIMAPKLVYTFDSDVKAYNPENDSWQNGVASPLERYGFGIAVTNDIFYVVGGYTYEPWGPFAPLSTNEEYIPFGYGTPDPSYVLEHTPPEIRFESPLNKTYTNSSISVIFRLNKNVTSASYSLDRQQNVTVTGNTSIANMPNGSHNVTIYVNDSYGNVGSKTVNFAIAVPAPFPTTMVVAIIASVAGISVGLIVYFKKRKR